MEVTVIVFEVWADKITSYPTNYNTESRPGSKKVCWHLNCWPSVV